MFEYHKFFIVVHDLVGEYPKTSVDIYLRKLCRWSHICVPWLN